MTIDNYISIFVLGVFVSLWAFAVVKLRQMWKDVFDEDSNENMGSHK